jgi:hypothetical protein
MFNSCSLPRALAPFVVITVTCLALASSAHAQCSTCAQPTVAFSPVQQTAFMPVQQTAFMPVQQTAFMPVQQTAFMPVQQTAFMPVQQTVVVPRDRWYPGRGIQRFFGWGDPVTTTRVVTTAYQPTFPPSFSAAPAPTTWTVGFASPACNSCGSNPCACSTSFRAVTLSPVSSCCSSPCDSCVSCGGGGCSSCGGGGVVSAGYDYAPSSGCSSCAGGAVQSTYESSPSNAGGYGLQPTPAPGLDPGANVPEQRQTNRPEDQAPAAAPDADNGLGGEEATWLQAPELYDPQARTTRRPTAPVWTAVYQKDTQSRGASAAVLQRTSTQSSPQPLHQKLDASGWGSASN